MKQNKEMTNTEIENPKLIVLWQIQPILMCTIIEKMNEITHYIYCNTERIPITSK